MGIPKQKKQITEDVRIGQLLVEMGYLAEDQLKQALREQIHREKLGIQSTVGEICVENDWCTMRDIAIAMKEQEEDIFHLSSLGQILMNLGFIGLEELDLALEMHKDLSAPIGETLVDIGICTEEQIRMALELQILYRNGVLRRAVISRYHPYNVMELIVNYEIDNVIAEREGCFCHECRANMFALAMNALPPRYVTDERLVLTFIESYRTEYTELVRHKLEEAVDKVKERPKGLCRGNRYRLDLERIAAAGEFVDQVIVHVSNRHVHLCAEHRDALFGEGYELTKWKDLLQPEQYAAKEVVTLVGEKGRIEKVRVLGPLRRETQVEISGTDQYILGLRAPVRDSGNLGGTPGIQLLGPAGEIMTDHGVIRALRHIHMTSEDARRIGVSNHDIVDVRLNGDRTTVCEGVLIRVSKPAVLEMHIDTDEANAAGVPSKSIGEILGSSFRSGPS
jgi:putative phosphotransacetylase